VLFGHDTERALSLAVALVNAPPGDAEQLRSFVDEQHLSGVGRLAAGDAAAVRQVASRLGAVFREGSESAAVPVINALLAESAATPQLTAHDGYPLHLHHFAPGAAIADHLAADCGMALATVLAAGEGERLRECAAGCGRVLVDLSRNRNRRYCDDRSCGNRLHVAAYRARHRARTADDERDSVGPQ
jgi:predicted RNA-binding Zn ribbon-like protein